MPRYFDKKTKVEVLDSSQAASVDVVELPEDHLFWKPLPEGKQLSYAENGLPIWVDLPPSSNLDKALLDVSVQGINGNTILHALFLKDEEALKDIEDRLKAIANIYGLDYVSFVRSVIGHN